MTYLEVLNSIRNTWAGNEFQKKKLSVCCVALEQWLWLRNGEGRTSVRVIRQQSYKRRRICMDLFLLYFTSTLFMDCSIKKATRIRDIYPVSRETTNIQKKTPRLRTIIRGSHQWRISTHSTEVMWGPLKPLH